MVSGYRRDIDILRAVAVLPVILFHLHVPGFGGGYVGVDVFFVISGFLITGLLLKGADAGTVELGAFYLRRVRRLAPALTVVTLVTVVGAWMKLYPEDLRSFASSLALQPLSLQNFLFLAEGEYFRGAEAKPLLHTWSLAVEEQFYLVWPWLVALTGRPRVRPLRNVTFVAVLVGSFALNLLLMRLSAKASFFLLPSRAWELAAGALLAVAATEGRFKDLTSTARAGLRASGLLAIVVAVVGFTDKTAFPGYAATLPVLGSLGFIAAGSNTSEEPQGVGSRPLVYIGQISYSLYLWHWPILVLWSYSSGAGSFSWPGRLAIVALSGSLASLTYHFVERPVRERSQLRSTRSLVMAATASAVACVGVALHLRETQGAAYRFDGAARAMLTAPLRARTDRCGFVFRALHPARAVCPLYQASNPARRILLWGTSHADQWSGLLTRLASAHGADLYLNARNCRATPDGSFCGPSTQKAVLRFATAERVTDVILASSWYGRYHVPDEVLERDLDQLLGVLTRHDIRAWLVVDTPVGDALAPISAYERSPDRPTFGAVPAEPLRARARRERALFESLSAKYGARSVKIIDPTSTYCSALECVGGLGEVAWYRDNEHLTDAGAALAEASFNPVFAPAP